MNVVLHRPKLDEEHKEFSEVVEKRIVEIKKEYCQKHGYKFIEDTSPNLTTHWNEDYWSHIPVILKIFEESPDVEWIFYVLSMATINDMDRPVFDIINEFPDKKLIIGAADFRMKKWYTLEDKWVSKLVLNPHVRRVFLSPCLFVKNCPETKEWLNKIYNDKRFNEGLFNEKHGREYDKYRKDGHHIPDHAFTLYYENYKKFNDLTGIITFGTNAKYNFGSIVLPEKTDVESMKALCNWAKLLQDSDTNMLMNIELHEEHLQKNFLKFITCNMTPENIFR
jgi:hypothetical protein